MPKAEAKERSATKCRGTSADEHPTQYAKARAAGVNAAANAKRSRAAKEQPRDGKRFGKKQVGVQSVQVPESQRAPERNAKARAAGVNAGANAKRSKAQKGVPKAEAKERGSTKCPTTLPANERETTKYAKARAAGVNAGANAKRSKAAKDGRVGRAAKKRGLVPQQSVAALNSADEHKTQYAKARAAGVNAGELASFSRDVEAGRFYPPVHCDLPYLRLCSEHLRSLQPAT